MPWTFRRAHCATTTRPGCCPRPRSTPGRTALVVGPVLSAAGIVVISLAPSAPLAFGGSVVMGIGSDLFTSHAFPLYILRTPPGKLAMFQVLLLVTQYLPSLIANNVLGAVSAGFGTPVVRRIRAAQQVTLGGEHVQVAIGGPI